MFYLKLTITGFLVVTIYGLVTCSNENITNTHTPLLLIKDNENLNDTLQVLKTNKTSLRSPRTLLTQSRNPAFTLRRRQPVQIRARADHLPLRTQMRRVQHNGLSNGQLGQQPNMRLGFESLKSSKFMPNSKGANLPFPSHGKGSVYRPQLKTGHPNAIHLPALSQQYMHNFKASPAFNGQVKVHPVVGQQTQNQQPPAAVQKDNSYPKYVKPQQPPAAMAVVSPQIQQQKKHQQQQIKPSQMKYPDFKQYPIPDQEKMQQHNEQHEKYLQQQKFLTPKNPIAYYQLQQHSQQQQQQHQELSATQPQQNYPVQQPLHYSPQAQHHQQLQPIIPIHESIQAHINSNNKINNNMAFPSAASVPPKMYSVYEENDMTELQTNNYQTAASYQGLDNKEAQEYLRFMNSDEYFLPKREPNYKRIDDEADKRQFNVLKAQAQAQQHLHSLQPLQQTQAYQNSFQNKAYLPQIYTPSASAQSPQYTNNLYVDTPDASRYNNPNPISRFFYQQDPTASASSASSTVVRTSYQTGYNPNQFVVNTQDKKIAKYTILPSSTTSSAISPTQPPPIAYPQLRHSNMAGNRTPEPLRFEFTERDAMVGSYAYTNAPQAQLRFREYSSNDVTPKVETSTKNYSNGDQHQAVKPIVEEVDDDPEEGDDMQEAGNSLFGRKPAVNNSDLKANKLSTTTTTTEVVPPNEQEDTEEYCERICAIVEDENEEIVCGSDGYMYTSEAQMECYASCLNIDVTIQGKGSCATR